MSSDSPTDRLAAIQARLDAATPGPWQIDQDSECVYGISSKELNRWDICETDSGCYGPNRRDADLIAHAPDDLAYLLQLLRIRDAQLSVAKDALERVQTEMAPNCKCAHDCSCELNWNIAIARKAMAQIDGLAGEGELK